VSLRNAVSRLVAGKPLLNELESIQNRGVLVGLG